MESLQFAQGFETLGIVGVLGFILWQLLSLYKKKDDENKATNEKVLEAFREQTKVSLEVKEVLGQLRGSIDQNRLMIQENKKSNEGLTEAIYKNLLDIRTNGNNRHTQGS